MRHADAERLAKSLMIKHGLSHWALTWNSAKRTCALTRFWGSFGGEIVLSRYYVTHATDEAILDTILHEIAHALAGRDAKPHGREWRTIALRIGCNGKTCGSADEMPNKPKARWQGTCRNGHTIEMHRAPRRVKACITCYRGFRPENVFTWRELGRPVHYLSMPDTYAREWHGMLARYASRMP